MSTAFIGFDLAKSVFQVHGVDVHDKVVVTNHLRHEPILNGRQPPTLGLPTLLEPLPVGVDPTVILVANSLPTSGSVMQGSKARAPGFGSRGIGPPRADPRQIDSDSRDDVLQARLGQADVAALPQVAPADRLTPSMPARPA
jgi:hypothetical protein